MPIGKIMQAYSGIRVFPLKIFNDPSPTKTDCYAVIPDYDLKATLHV